MITDVLDAFGLLLIALGVGLLVATVSAPGWGFLASGVIMLAGSAVATFTRRQPARGEQ